MDEEVHKALDIMRRKADSDGLEYVYRRMWLHEWQGMYVVAGIGNCGDRIIKIPAAIRTEFGGGDVPFPRDITVGKIGSMAFSGNESAEGVVLTKIYEIGDGAFENCRSLKWIYLPKCLNKIGSAAFAGCENLDTIFYEGTEGEFKKIRITTVNQDVGAADGVAADSGAANGGAADGGAANGGAADGAKAPLCDSGAPCSEPLNVKIFYNCRL